MTVVSRTCSRVMINTFPHRLLSDYLDEGTRYHPEPKITTVWSRSTDGRAWSCWLPTENTMSETGLQS